MDKHLSKTVAYLPIKLLLGFLVITELLLFLGPKSYNLQCPLLLIIYLGIVNIALFQGYRCGVKRYKYKYKEQNQNDLRIVKIVILIALIISPISLVLRWGLTSISLTSIISRFFEGIFNPASVYSDYISSLDGHNLGTLNTILLAFLSPITFAAIPFGIAYWRNIPRKFHILICLLIIVEFAYWIGIGTRKGLLDLLLMIIFLVVANKYELIENKKKRRLFIFFSAIFLFIFIFYFIYSSLSRISIDLANIASANIAEIKPFYEKNITPIIYIPLLSVSDYLCQGYYALSCALKMSFLEPIFTFGWGNNFFSMVFLDRVFGYDFNSLMSMTYQGELYKQYNIHPTVNWHTIYVWLANDFTFLGVPIIIYLIGYFLSNTWLSTVYKNNLYAAPLFSLFAIMVFYFFANNQILSSSFIAFISILFLYSKHQISVLIQFCLKKFYFK